MTRNPSSLLSLDVQVATFGSLSSSSSSSYSPSTVLCADHRSIWAPPKQSDGNHCIQAVVRDGCSEVSPLSHETGETEMTRDRYKTELCRPFEESGFCKYGNRCQFAHGRQQLRMVDRHPKYKTQLCQTFHTTGLCRYGKRCHFIHYEDEEAAHSHCPSSVPKHQQQHPVPGLRKLTGRQNVESAVERQHSILSTSSSSFISGRYPEERPSLVSRITSLPSSTASSPSSTPSHINSLDGNFSSAAAFFQFSQMPNLRQAPPGSPYSSLFQSTDLFTHPSPSIQPSATSDFVQPKSIFNQDDDKRRRKDDVIDLLVRHLTKAQMELIVEYLLQREKGNSSI